MPEKFPSMPSAEKENKKSWEKEEDGLRDAFIAKIKSESIRSGDVVLVNITNTDEVGPGLGGLEIPVPAFAADDRFERVGKEFRAEYIGLYKEELIDKEGMNPDAKTYSYVMKVLPIIKKDALSRRQQGELIESVSLHRIDLHDFRRE